MKNKITLRKTMLRLALALLQIQLLFGALPEIPEDPIKAALWKQRRVETIENLANSPIETATKGLRDIIVQLDTLNYRECPEKTYILELARTRHLEIPAWENYYRDRILDARAKMEAEPDQALRDDMYYRTMANVVFGFGMLGRLSTPASVRVLGDFLSDERGRFILSPEEAKRDNEHIRWLSEVRRANCEYAVGVINSMPIVDKPVRKDRATFKDVPAWREWYERIKSGRATFRFEGDPVEYDLDGPAPPEKLARIAADRERDARRENRRNGSATDNEKPATTAAEASPPVSRLPILLAAAILAAAVGWYVLRRMKRGPA